MTATVSTGFASKFTAPIHCDPYLAEIDGVFARAMFAAEPHAADILATAFGGFLGVWPSIREQVTTKFAPDGHAMVNTALDLAEAACVGRRGIRHAILTAKGYIDAAWEEIHGQELKALYFSVHCTPTIVLN